MNDKTKSEYDIVPELDDIISKETGRIFVTCFSSNIFRIQTLINIANKRNKKVIPFGRSMNKYIELAIEQNILKNHKNVIKSVESLSKNHENTIILVSGCQGDFKSTLRRIALGDDSTFKLQQNDLFIFSSKTIPGNERKIANIINKLCESGCRIITSDDRMIHTSGHPGKDDLKKVYDLFKPTDAVPIHGESLFLQRHLEFIKENYPQTSPHLVYNHHSIFVDQNLKITTRENEPLDPILIHGNGIPIERKIISQRRKIATNGMVLISINKSSLDFKYNFSGIPDILFDEFLRREIKIIKMKDTDKYSETLRISVRRFLNSILGYKPVVVIHLL